MLMLRLGRTADLPQIERLAAASPVGVTALPASRERLADILAASEASMAEEVTFSGEERYFFCLRFSLSFLYLSQRNVCACLA